LSDRSIVKSRVIRYGLTALAALLAIGVLALLVRGLMKPSAPTKKQVVQQIQLVRPPPPPPPKEQPKPPEIKPREEVKVNEPPPPTPQAQPANNEPPPAAALGVDAQGGAGGDNFGLVGRPGGRDITTLGKDGGGVGGGVSRLAFASYTNLLQQRIQDEISRNQQLRSGDYRAVVRVWLTREGAIQRVEMVGSSGDPERDQLIRSSLASMAPLREPPPENMPQPVRLRITSRATG